MSTRAARRLNWAEVSRQPMTWHAIRPGPQRIVNGWIRHAETGVCVLCGARLNPKLDYNKDCPNPRRLTRAAAMMEAQGISNGKGRT